MSMAENEPAFPHKQMRNTSTDPLATPREVQFPGMSLRDWFAGQAIGAIIAATSAGQHYPGAGRDDDRPIQDKMAADAYRIADALATAGGRS